MAGMMVFVYHQTIESDIFIPWFQVTLTLKCSLTDSKKALWTAGIWLLIAKGIVQLHTD